MWQTVLAAMLWLQPPGATVYSRVVVEAEAPRPCENVYSLLCRPPRWSHAHQAYTVAEGWEQGARRYATIAKALAIVLDLDERTTPRQLLWQIVLAMAWHESGFRRDTHSGIGHAARGDCKRRRAPWTCTSHCLVQINMGPAHTRAKTDEGYSPRDLVGLSLDATVRCLEVGTRYVDTAYRRCGRNGMKPHLGCVISIYMGAADWQDKRVAKRTHTVYRLAAAPTELGARARDALGLPPRDKP